MDKTSTMKRPTGSALSYFSQAESWLHALQEGYKTIRRAPAISRPDLRKELLEVRLLAVEYPVIPDIFFALHGELVNGLALLVVAQNVGTIVPAAKNKWLDQVGHGLQLIWQRLRILQDRADIDDALQQELKAVLAARSAEQCIAQAFCKQEMASNAFWN